MESSSINQQHPLARRQSSSLPWSSFKAHRNTTTILVTLTTTLILVLFPTCTTSQGYERLQQPSTCSRVLDFDYDECIDEEKVYQKIANYPYCNNNSYAICQHRRNFTNIDNEPITSQFFPGNYFLIFFIFFHPSLGYAVATFTSSSIN